MARFGSAANDRRGWLPCLLRRHHRWCRPHGRAVSVIGTALGSTLVGIIDNGARAGSCRPVLGRVPARCLDPRRHGSRPVPVPSIRVAAIGGSRSQRRMREGPSMTHRRRIRHRARMAPRAAYVPFHTSNGRSRSRTVGVTKRFPGVLAVAGATSHGPLRGEILALVGENGAGKSTLIKIITGNYQADHGQMVVMARGSHQLAAGLHRSWHRGGAAGAQPHHSVQRGREYQPRADPRVVGIHRHRKTPRGGSARPRSA